jgi:hypothetical protein
MTVRVSWINKRKQKKAKLLMAEKGGDDLLTSFRLRARAPCGGSGENSQQFPANDQSSIHSRTIDTLFLFSKGERAVSFCNILHYHLHRGRHVISKLIAGVKRITLTFVLLRREKESKFQFIWVCVI